MIQLYSDIKGNGPPTKSTPGAVGQIYIDRETGLRYECIEAFVQKGYKVNREIYTWEEKASILISLPRMLKLRRRSTISVKKSELAVQAVAESPLRLIPPFRHGRKLRKNQNILPAKYFSILI